jgi:hypothetical protein
VFVFSLKVRANCSKSKEESFVGFIGVLSQLFYGESEDMNTYSLRGLHLPERLLFLVYAAVRAAQFDLQDFLCTQRERYKGASLLGVLIWAEEARERLFFL